jgi:hypothetical protein
MPTCFNSLITPRPGMLIRSASSTTACLNRYLANQSHLFLNSIGTADWLPFILNREPMNNTQQADGYQKTATRIHPKGVTPDVLIGGPVLVSPGFPIKAFGNDGL